MALSLLGQMPIFFAHQEPAQVCGGAVAHGLGRGGRVEAARPRPVRRRVSLNLHVKHAQKGICTAFFLLVSISSVVVIFSFVASGLRGT
jgi:hypothetical protein